MWLRLRKYLVCPLCKEDLELEAFDSRKTSIDATNSPSAATAESDLQWVEAGLLLCNACRHRYPIYKGLPILLPYSTPVHSMFADAESDNLRRFRAHAWPSETPVPGERFVMQSFSKEWLDYDYDGVLWDLSYEDHKARLLAEIGPAALSPGATFVEIGSGLGMSTFFAQQALKGEAIGVDLSLAALSATRHFREHPFLHFVQASVFWLPVRDGVADVLYSHGVLHHTYSTRDAFLAATRCSRVGGTAYVWLYGTDSLKGSPARRMAWRIEQRLRPIVARNLENLAIRGVISALAVPYLLVNRWHRLRDTSVQKYTYQRALHAARDRFTPLFAHRQDYEEVSSWFIEAGYDSIERVDWRTMPSSNQDNYRRNTGVRGRRVKAPDATSSRKLHH